MEKERFYAVLSETVYGNNYLNLIQEARSRKDLVPGEDHHIHPKCLGGSLYLPENIVRLTYYEHILAHYYLTLAFSRSSKLFCAFKCMSQIHIQKVTDVEKIKLEQLEEWARLREKQHNFDHVLITDGTRSRFVPKTELGSLESGWYVGMSEPARSKRYGNNHHMHKVVGEKGRENLSKSHSGKRWVSNPETLESTAVFPEEAEQMVQTGGWVYGRLNCRKSKEDVPYIGQRALRFISDLKNQKSFKVYRKELDRWLSKDSRFVLGRLFWGKEKLLEDIQDYETYLYW